MARPGPQTFAKLQREAAKREKKRAKREKMAGRKAEKKAMAEGASNGLPSPPVDDSLPE